MEDLNTVLNEATGKPHERRSSLKWEDQEEAELSSDLGISKTMADTMAAQDMSPGTATEAESYPAFDETLEDETCVVKSGRLVANETLGEPLAVMAISVRRSFRRAKDCGKMQASSPPAQGRPTIPQKFSTPARRWYRSKCPCL